MELSLRVAKVPSCALTLFPAVSSLAVSQQSGLETASNRNCG